MAKSVADYQTAFQNFMEKGARYYACPTGTMLPFAGKTVPAGFLLCNGAAISRKTYARLFSVLGTTWGAGDGSTTFNLPNVNDRCLEGTTNTANVGKYLEAGLPDITGNYAATDWFRDISRIQSSGALFNDTSKGSRSQTGASGYSGSQTVGFQAAKSNATFGKSSIVQPNTFYTLMIVKV